MSYDYRYAKRWRHARMKGVLQYCDATEVREHLANLLANGATYALIARYSGLNKTTVRDVALARNKGTTRKTEVKLLAVPFSCVFDQPSPEAHVPRFASIRRVHALLAMGYTHKYMTEYCGVNTWRFGSETNRTRTTLKKHLAIKQMFSDLSHILGPSEQTRKRCRKRNYAPPMAWDDIEDPREQPKGVLRKSAKCGTPAGEQRHRRHKEAICDDCRVAKLEAKKDWYARNKKVRAA